MRTCFLCGRNGALDPLEKHHIFGGPYRKKSEKYKLYVWLCGERCHRLGKNAAHNCRETELKLKRYGQRKAMREQGWNIPRFIREFGRNYIDLEESENE